MIDQRGYKVDSEDNPVFKERTYRTQNTWQTITLTPVPGQEIPPSGKFYIPSMDNILFLDESTQYPIEQTGQGFTIHPTVTGMVEIRGWFLDDYSTKPDGEPPIYRFYWTQKLGSITPTELAAQPVTAPEPEAAPQTEELEKPSRVERKPEEQLMIRDLCRQITDEKIRPVAAELDRTEKFPWDVMKVMAQSDLFGVYIDEAYGGMGGGITELCIATEEFSRGCAGIAICYSASALGTYPILLFGNDETIR